MSDIIEIRDLVVCYHGAEAPALKLPELRVARGDRLCVLGASGSGKTSLLNVIAGMLPHDVVQGEVNVAGTNLRALSEKERDQFRADHIGYVFQRFELAPSLSALENVMLAGTFGQKRDRHTLEKEATERLEALAVAHRKDAKPAALSVGEAQRVAIARATLGSPELLLADEPTANLDDNAALAVLDLLDEAAQDRTLLIVTHDSRVKTRFDAHLDLST